MTMEVLELRLRSLERRSARLKIVVLLAVVLAVGATLTSVSENLWADPPRPVVQDTVRANRIEVVDRDGKLLAVLGKLIAPEPVNQTTTGLALVSNDKQVVRLALTKSDRDGSLSSAELRVSNPEDAKQLFSAGVVEFSHIGLVPEVRLDQRESKSSTTVDPNGLRVSVKIDELTSAEAISLHAKEDHSATLSLGGLFRPFKVRAIAESDKPRFEVAKGGEIKTFGFVP